MDTSELSSSKKRKHTDADTADGNGTSTKESKKKKKKKDGKKEKDEVEHVAATGTSADDKEEDADDDEKEKKKAKKPQDSTQGGKAREAQHLPAEEQADFIWSTFSTLMRLSPLEKEHPLVTSSHLVAPKRKKNKYKKKQQQQNGGVEGTVNLSSTALTDFLKQALPSLASLASDKKNRIPGSPFVIIVRYVCHGDI